MFNLLLRTKQQLVPPKLQFKLFKFSTQLIKYQNAQQEENVDHNQQGLSARSLTVKITNAQDLNSLQQFLKEGNYQHINNIHIAAIISRMKNFYSTNSAQQQQQQQQIFFDDLWKQLGTQLNQLNGNQLAMTVLGIGRLGIKLNWQQSQQLVSMIKNDIDRMNLKSTSMVLQGLGNMSNNAYIRDVKILQIAANNLKQQINIHAQLKDIDFQNLILSMWALTKLDYKDDDLLAIFGDIVFNKQQPLLPKQIALITWILGKQKVLNIPLLCSLQEQAKSQIKEFNSQDLANFLWGLSEAGHHDTELCQTIANTVLDSKLAMRPQELSNMLLVFARCDAFHSTLLAQVGKMLSDTRFQGFSAQHISNILWSYMQLRYRHDDMLRTIIQIVVNNIDRFPPIAYLTLVQAVSQFDFREKQFELYGLVTEHSLKEYKRGRLQLQELIRMVLSFAQSDYWDKRLLYILRESIIQQLKLNNQFQYQVYQQAAHIDLLGIPRKIKFLDTLDPEFAKKSKQSFCETNITVSEIQELDYQAFCELGLEPRMEFGIFDNRMTIDIALEYEGQKVAVEVDGYSHFVWSQEKGYQMTGKTISRNRLLESDGWRVVSIPFYELSKDLPLHARKRYLEKKLLGEEIAKGDFH